MIPPAREAEPSARRDHAGELAAAASAGDRDAFGELYRLHYGEVFAFVRRRTPTCQLAEDIVSETFIRALRAIEGFAWIGGGFAGWLITIARNLLADHYKSAYHQRENLVRDGTEPDGLTPGPEEIVVERLVREAVLASLERLNPLQRACITARFLEELTVTETAERLDRMENSIKSLQYRATRTLARDARLSAVVAS